jgi:hypothetical protein
MARALTPPTLGQLHRPPGWVWVYCTRYHPLCQHRAPMALAPLISGGDRMRRATCCGGALAARCAGTRARLCRSRMEERLCRVGAVPVLE